MTVTDPAHLVDPERARITLDGRAVQFEPRVYVLLNKPRGPISAVTDPRGRPTVVDLVEPAGRRLYPAGRLDADTEGLLLITNDGELALRLTHPRYGVSKVYQAEVVGRPSSESLRRLEQGVALEDGPAAASRARLLRGGADRSLVEVTVHAGRKRMVRRMLQAVGHPVVALRRVQVGPLTLGDLRPGEWRELTAEELAGLWQAANSAAPQREAEGRGRGNRMGDGDAG